jgi:hypothetical protein
MGNTKAGGLKTRQTNLAKYGADYYKEIGKLGGSVKHPKKGFGSDNRTLLQKFLREPKRAAIEGAKGGKLSKRGMAKV